MSILAFLMIGAGIAVLLAGLFLVWPRFAAASGAGRILVLGPVFEAVALTIFAAEHFMSATISQTSCRRWLPAPLFWTYLVGAALLAAAISFIAWRYVRWSASLLALLFLIIVVTIDLPNLPQPHPSAAVLDTHSPRNSLRRRSDGAGRQPMAPPQITRSDTHPPGPVHRRCYLHLLCNRALPLPPLRPRRPTRKDDARLGPSAHTARLSRWRHSAGRRRRPDDPPHPPHRRRHCRHSASAANHLLLHPNLHSRDPHSTRGRRGQLHWRYLTVRSHSLAGRLQNDILTPPSVLLVDAAPGFTTGEGEQFSRSVTYLELRPGELDISQFFDSQPRIAE